MDAIESGNTKTFKYLGGDNNFDLNFEITSEGLFPLLVASSKGE